MLYIATLIRKEYFLNKANLIIEEVNKVIIGKEKVIRKVWMTILSGGHVLLEDVPGVGKTTMALAFSSEQCYFNRTSARVENSKERTNATC